jgi:hypothetical protein
MNIILTESQYCKLLENQIEINSKPAVTFDSIYGTNLSQQYDFGDGLTSDDVWGMWVKCRDYDDCDDILELSNRLQTIFPYINTSKLTNKQKVEILMGMSSEFNAPDIVSFAVHKIYGDKNIEQKRLTKQLPPEVAYNLQWVLSQHSMDIIRSKFGINEI